MPHTTARGGPLARAAREVLDLVLPVTCAGCGVPGRPLCPGCLHAFAGPPRRCEHAAGRLDRMDGTTVPVWALAENDGAVRRAVVGWKDRGRADVTPWFGAVLRRAGPAVRRALAGAADGEPVPLLVVPAPASPRGRARRGEDLVGALARPAAAGLGGAVALTALRLAGAGRDQVGLGVRGRAANLAGRVRVRPRARAALAGTCVLLVDDVLTTGATLAACRSALEAAGARVVGATVLAVTRPPGSPTGWLEASADPG
ncbi:ComF family protein [Cellulomonas sp. GbtcB1]|uniref:ComF family protein n=1 Tax=Cellulomonas sp. GbtcB1 TaxID=2824746 RepID=UPI001C304E86|nr:phosphoribosyltransferase family protein [Cellulomonas sp. GbtcB1]